MDGLTTPRFTALPPLSLYVHIPWCARKCPYCDFNSHAVTGDLPNEQRYVNALMTDLESELPSVWGRTVNTIFFGGGTPSLFSARAIDDILCGVRARLKLSADAEITLEANPGTVEAEKFADFRAAGVNRLSIGIQSFNDQHLQALGRIHDSAAARRAIDIAQRSFDNFNLDVMYALPQQSAQEAIADIAAAIAYAPAHISAYHLTLEPNTVFAHAPPPIPDEDVSADIEAAVHERLAASGYARYETSAFAHASSLRAAHNLNYWRFGDYLGIGAGAHGKISSATAIARTAKHKQPESYMTHLERSGSAITERRALTRSDVGFEFMLNALRLIEGFSPTLFPERTGFPISLINKPLEQAVQRGLLRCDHANIAPTELGQRFLNELQMQFLR